MFKKIVSQLSFSPALVGQLGFYAKRLRKEQTTRRLGLIFVALALVVQSLVVFQPPEPANAANAADMIPGGLGLGSARTLNNFLGPYDRNERNLQDIYNYFGITREEITNTRFGYFIVGSKIGWGYEARGGSSAVTITNGAGQPVNTLYGRPLSIANGANADIYAYIGHSAKAGWFAIMQYCGNLVTEGYPSPPPPPPAPAKIVASKTALNTTQSNIDATKTAAKEKDKISFTVNAENTGGTAKTVELSDNLTDVLEFSQLIDTGGGTFDPETKILSWPSVNLTPGAKVSKTFAVQMNSSLVTTKTECKMSNTFFDYNIDVPVGCTTPPAKIDAKKTAVNLTQGNVTASTVTAKPGDRITFTLSVENTGGTPKDVVLEDFIGDTLEYATLIDNGGGTYTEENRLLSWPTVTLAPGAKEIRAFTVKILDKIPSTPQGLSDASSYDCRIENSFYGSDVYISVSCPNAKVIEQVKQLPHTGPRENMLFAVIVFAVVLFFYLRARQLGTEVRLIRRDLNGGTI